MLTLTVDTNADFAKLDGYMSSVMQFSDDSELTEEKVEYNSGITTGVDQYLKFSPKNKLTRGQVGQLFYNVHWTTKTESKVEQ